MPAHSDTKYMIPSQPVFALSPYCCVFSREATYTNFIVFGIKVTTPFVLFSRVHGDDEMVLAKSFWFKVQSLFPYKKSLKIPYMKR